MLSRFGRGGKDMVVAAMFGTANEIRLLMTRPLNIPYIFIIHPVHNQELWGKRSSLGS